MKENLKEIYKKYREGILSTIFQIILVIFCLYIINEIYDDKPTYNPAIKYEYEEVFDLTKIPSGLIIWRHGVPNFEREYKFAEPSLRYKYFDVGIYNKEKGKVFKVRIPYYAIGMFMGTEFNSKGFQQKRTPKNNYYQYPRKQNI